MSNTGECGKCKKTKRVLTNGKCNKCQPALPNLPKACEHTGDCNCLLFFLTKVIPTEMGDSVTNPPVAGRYRNLLVVYEADNTRWLYDSCGIPSLISGSVPIAQEMGDSTVAVMSQKAVTDQINRIDNNIDSIEENLYGTGASGLGNFLKDRIKAGANITVSIDTTTTPDSLKIAAIVPEVVQTTGTSTAVVMSQKSVTDALNALQAAIDAINTGVINIIAGNGITVNNTNPANPIISAILYTTTGQSTNGSMTQKATTDALTSLDTRIDNEATTRAQADTLLQSQIDSLSVLRVIRGMVATYADLASIPNKRVNDGWIVENDETRDGDTTIYTWNGSAWIFGGIVSQDVDLSGYRKAADQDIIDNAQNTAIQNAQTTANAKVDKTTFPNAMYATSSTGTASIIPKPYILVAASDSTTAVKNKADYVCTGTFDQTIINTAIGQAFDSPGGRVVLARGTFNLASYIDIATGVSVEGMKNNGSTILKLADGSTSFAIRALNKNSISIKNLTIDGNYANRGVNTNSTILIQNTFDVLIQNVAMSNLMHHGFEVSFGSKNVTIEDCVVDTTTGDGIELEQTQTADNSTKDIVINRCKFSNVGVLANPSATMGQSGAEFETWCAAQFNDCIFENMVGGFFQSDGLSTSTPGTSIIVEFNNCSFSRPGVYYVQILASDNIRQKFTFNGCTFDGAGVSDMQTALFRPYTQCDITLNDCTINNVTRLYRHQSATGANSTFTMNRVIGRQVGGISIVGSTPTIAIRLIDSDLTYLSVDNPLYAAVAAQDGKWVNTANTAGIIRSLEINGSVLRNSPDSFIMHVPDGRSLDVVNSRVLNSGLAIYNPNIGIFQIMAGSIGNSHVNISDSVFGGNVDYAVYMDNSFSTVAASTDITIANNRFDVNVIGIRNLDIARQTVNNPMFKYSVGASKTPVRLSGVGSPEGVIEGAPGTLYVDTTFVSNIGLWIKKTGTGTTGWVVENYSGILPVSNGGTGNSTVDTVPAAGSTNMVTSGGVYTALLALDALKENLLSAGTSAQYYRGDKTWATLNKSSVGLANVDNTADTAKPISTATQTALNLKSDIKNFIIVNGVPPTATINTTATEAVLTATNTVNASTDFSISSNRIVCAKAGTVRFRREVNFTGGTTRVLTIEIRKNGNTNAAGSLLRLQEKTHNASTALSNLVSEFTVPVSAGDALSVYATSSGGTQSITYINSTVSVHYV